MASLTDSIKVVLVDVPATKDAVFVISDVKVTKDGKLRVSAVKIRLSDRKDTNV